LEEAPITDAKTYRLFEQMPFEEVSTKAVLIFNSSIMLMKIIPWWDHYSLHKINFEQLKLKSSPEDVVTK